VGGEPEFSLHTEYCHPHPMPSIAEDLGGGGGQVVEGDMPAS